MSTDLSQFSEEYINYDEGPVIVGLSVAIGILSLVSVGLRLWAKNMKGVQFGLEDWLIIACVVRQLETGSAGRRLN